MSSVLNAKKRATESEHRSTLTKLRKNGAIPGVVYGYQIESTPIELNGREFAKELAKIGMKSVFQLDVAGTKVNAVLTEIQRCALKGIIKHVDFKAINMSEELEVDIPVTVKGDAVGVADGGFLLQPNREVRIKVNPTNIPEAIEVDVTNLAIGTTIYVKDIRAQYPFEILQEDDYSLVTITPPTAEGDQEDMLDSTPEVIEETGKNSTTEDGGE